MKTMFYNQIWLFVLGLLFSGNAIAQQWIKLASPSNAHLHDVYFLNEDYGAVVGDTGTVLLTRNGGATWESIPVNTKSNISSVLVLNEDTLLVAAGTYFDGEVYRTTNGGADWTKVAEGIELAVNNADYFALNSKNVLHSDDQGASWDSTDILIGSTTLLAQLAFPDKSTGYALGIVSGFSTYSSFGYRSIDGGFSWQPFFQLDFPNSDAWTNSFFPNADLGFVFTNQFERFLPGSRNRLAKISNFYFEPNFMVWRFTSSVVNDSMPTYINASHFFDAENAFALGADGSIYKTSDGGVNWDAIYTGDQALKSIAMLDEGIGYAVGDDGTILKYAKTTSTQAPSQIFPIQLYPNPAAGMVHLDGLKDWNGIISIYNAMGQNLRQISLNGNNVVDLSGLANGWYLLEIRTDGQVYQGKLIVQN